MNITKSVFPHRSSSAGVGFLGASGREFHAWFGGCLTWWDGGQQQWCFTCDGACGVQSSPSQAVWQNFWLTKWHPSSLHGPGRGSMLESLLAPTLVTAGWNLNPDCNSRGWRSVHESLLAPNAVRACWIWTQTVTVQVWVAYFSYYSHHNLLDLNPEYDSPRWGCVLESLLTLKSQLVGFEPRL